MGKNMESEKINKEICKFVEIKIKYIPQPRIPNYLKQLRNVKGDERQVDEQLYFRCHFTLHSLF